MQPRVQSAQTAQELRDTNRRFYDSLWSGARLVEPQQFNTWPLVRSLLPRSTRRLEVAPGLRPRLPLEDTQFVDISAPALAKLRGRNAHVVLGEVTCLPFADDAFDLVCAFDIIEHVDDDDGALSELSRVARPGGTLLISTPLHPLVGLRSMTSWATRDATSHNPCWQSLRSTSSPLQVAPCLGCSRDPRFSSTWECGGSRIIGNAPCGGTTAR